MSKNSVKNFLSDERESFDVTDGRVIAVQTPEEINNLVSIQKDTPPPPYDMASNFPVAASNSAAFYGIPVVEQQDVSRSDEDITSPPPAYNQIVTTV